MAHEAQATHLLLVRHGQSLGNLDPTLSDQDTGLTETGWLQSQALADWLASSYQAEIVVASTLRRALQTAEIVSWRLGLPLALLPGLEEAEQSYWEELPTTPRDAPLALWDAVWQPAPERAPIYWAFRERVRQALAEVLAAHGGKTVILVSHGGTIGTILRSLIGGHHAAMHTENTGLSHVAWQEGRWRLMLHNSRAHLTALSPAAAGEESAAASPLPWAKGSHVRAVVGQYRRISRVDTLVEDSGDEEPAERLVQMAPLTAGDSVLEIGCGSGTTALAFAPHVAEVIGVDVCPAMLEVAERRRITRKVKNAQFRWAEATELPFADGTFNLVVCHDLLRYVGELTALLHEARRVLAPGGRLLLEELVGCEDAVKRATHEAIEIERDLAFLRAYTVEEILNALALSGLRVEVAEQYERQHEVEQWLARAAAPESAREKVRLMIEASLPGDAAGLRVHRRRDGTLVFAERRIRLAASVNSGRDV